MTIPVNADTVVIRGYWWDEATRVGVAAQVSATPLPFTGNATPNLSDVSAHGHIKTRPWTTTPDPQSGLYALPLLAPNDPDLAPFAGHRMKFGDEPEFTVLVDVNAPYVTADNDLVAALATAGFSTFVGAQLRAMWLTDTAIVSTPAPAPPVAYLTASQTVSAIASSIDDHDSDSQAHPDIRALIQSGGGGSQVVDATTSVKGVARILGGTADSPTVPYSSVTGKPSSLPPSGGAGGVLGGSYPNPGFAVDMATQAELDTAIGGVRQVPSGASAGQVLTATSSTAYGWAAAPAGSGSGFTGSSATPQSAAYGRFASRDTRAVPIVTLGSSTSAGVGASSDARAMMTRWVGMVQTDHPLTSGAAQPSTIGVATAVSLPAAGIVHVKGGASGSFSSTYLPATRVGQVAALNPAVLVHVVGSNDYGSQIAVATYKTNVTGRLDALDGAITVPHVHVLVHAHRRTSEGARTIPWSAYGIALREVATARTNAVFVDLSAAYSAVGADQADPTGLMSTDKIHLTDAGHAYGADLLRAALRLTHAFPSAAPSGADLAAVADASPPTAPTGLATSAGNGSVTLTWSAAADDVGVASYRVYCNGALAGSPTATSFTVTGLTNGTGYVFSVAAADTAGNLGPHCPSVAGTPSAGAAPDTEAPTAPTNLTVTPGNGQNSLSWTASTDNTAVSGYRVKRDGSVVGNPTGTSYVDTGLTNGTSYTYQVTALDAAGNESTAATGSGAPVGGAPAGTTLVSDNFNRADSATSLGTTDTGQTWQALTGTWGITSGKAARVNSGNGTAVVNAGAGNLDVSAVITAVSSTNNGLVFRCSGADTDRLSAWIDVANQNVTLYRNSSGTSTLLTSIAQATTADTDYTLRVVANGASIKVYVNGTLRIDYTLAAADQTKFEPFTYIGFRGSTTAQRWDNLVATSI